MASLTVALAVICASFSYSLAVFEHDTQEFQRLKPHLGTYQDISKCAHQGNTWYVSYRNTEEGGFGPHDFCLRDYQISELVDGKARFRFRYGHGHERNATFTFKSSEGQTVKNVVAIQLDGAPQEAIYDVLFVDCKHCKVLRSRTGNRCLSSVTEAAFRYGVPQHCQFLHDLLCGTAPKYEVSDARCLQDDKKFG